MLVTTTHQPDDSIIRKAKEWAQSINGRYVPRKKHSVSKLQSIYDNQRIWICSKVELKYIQGAEPPLFFHPSTALVRVKRVINGEQDTLMTCANMQAGDSVLDCTAGLASDSIVFSFVGGLSSQVTAIESERVPYLLVKEGLKHYHSELPQLNEAMRRIHVLHADHLQYLQQLANNSVDIIYFDPMFRQAIDESVALSPLREVANPRPLQLEAIQEATRVARKCVVLKEHRDSAEFARLSFTEVHRSYSKIAYGVIRC